MNREEALLLIKQEERNLKRQFDKLDDISFANTQKVLDAFKRAGVGLMHMAPSSGYGYEDISKPKLCEVYKYIFNTEDAIVAPHITCGTHALTLPLFGILRPGDTALSITGQPYDTMQTVIYGEKGSDIGALKDFNINFECVAMKGDKIDTAACTKLVKKLNPKLIYIQRSRGYSTREALPCKEIKRAVDAIRKVNKDVIVFVDNCYGEFTEKLEPTDVGADLMAGSLMKNIGGGIAPTGGYVAGKSKYVQLAAGRLTAPSIGLEVGSYIASYYPFFEGLFIAPHVVAGAIKGNILLGKVLLNLGIESSPKPNILPCDIVRSIKFNSADKLVKFCQIVQRISPIDSSAVPEPCDMPGYEDKVVSGGGTFIQGSTMELSCDGPIRPPYICYLQGGLTYEHVKILCLETLVNLG